MSDRLVFAISEDELEMISKSDSFEYITLGYYVFDTKEECITFGKMMDYLDLWNYYEG